MVITGDALHQAAAALAACEEAGAEIEKVTLTSSRIMGNVEILLEGYVGPNKYSRTFEYS